MSERWQRRSRGARDARDADPSQTQTSQPAIIGILGRPSDRGPAPHHSSDHDSIQSMSSQSQTSGDVASTNTQGDGVGARAADKPIVKIKPREVQENRSTSVSPSPIPASAQNPADSNIPHPTHPQPPSHALYGATPQQRHGSVSQQSVESGQNRLIPPPEMKHCINIIDENFNWNDEGIEDLVDQTDCLVVGAIGLQGAGKSTVLSLLAGNTAQDSYRSYVFQPQVKETREEALHQTAGVDMFVSPERIIFLDTQPVFSTSVLDCMIRQEKKYIQEYASSETNVEIQSLQIASFLMTVCHVIIVAQDWFTDIAFLRFLQTAEMLRPHTHISSHEGSQTSSHQDDSPEFYPTVMFLLNKASQDDFSPETYNDMKVTLHSIFRSSKLHYQGAVNMHKDGVISAVRAKEEGCFVDVNLFLLPTMEYYKTEPESILTTLPDYRGFPSFAFLLRSLRNQIYSVPRLPMSPTPLSERNWFHFAARTWEAVKKSQLIGEYSRLLP